LPHCVLVADGILGSLPFAAIVDPATSRYLAQTFAFAQGERILAAADNDASRADSIRSALVVANDKGTFQGRGLPNLPLAISEARDVAGLYHNAVTLIGPDATVGRFRAGIQQADVVHIAAHAVSVPSVPDRSVVVLKTGEGEEELTARTIETSTSTRAEVVVLAACRSALSRTYAGQGPIGLASAFLRAGARRVIGSLWEVDDGMTRDLMIRFHRALAAGESPLVALSTAQRGLLESGGDMRHARHWAAWILLSRDVATALRGLRPAVSLTES
jgi:CHAT domain-containing protein